MLNHYKEIFLGLLLGLTMWVADALMHTMLPLSETGHQPTLLEELLFPDDLQLITRLLFVGFAFFLGWLLWRSNQRTRAVRDLAQRMETFHQQTSIPASLIIEECNILIQSSGLDGEALKVVKELRQHARQIESSTNELPLRPKTSG